MAQEYRCYCMLIAVVLVLLLEPSTSAPAAAHHLDNSATKQEQHSEQQPRGARLLDRFNHRYPDGSYEFRFELDDGTARYERGYFAFIDEVKTLMVVGYYSYRMPDGRYITVFYNADQFGYRQNQSITPEVYPNLPRSIDVPILRETTTTTAATVGQTASSQYQFQQSTTSSNYASSTPRAALLPLTIRRGRY